MTEDDYLTKHFDLVCKNCKSNLVLMSTNDEELRVNCTKCKNEFVISFIE